MATFKYKFVAGVVAIHDRDIKLIIQSMNQSKSEFDHSVQCTHKDVVRKAGDLKI